jgi:hypothetical protein
MTTSVLNMSQTYRKMYKKSLKNEALSKNNGFKVRYRVRIQEQLEADTAIKEYTNDEQTDTLKRKEAENVLQYLTRG